MDHDFPRLHAEGLGRDLLLRVDAIALGEAAPGGC